MKIEQLVVTAISKHKRYSEDSYYVSEGINDNDDDWFFGAVTDGHGPSYLSTSIVRYADYVAVNLYEEFIQSKDVNGFHSLFDTVAKSAEDYFGKVSYGAVALCVALKKTDSFFTIAHAGDCRAYRYAPETPYCNLLLTADHNAENPIESERIRSFGPNHAVREITYGVDSNDRPIKRLAVGNEQNVKMLIPTRGFGDYDFHPVFIHVPEVKQIIFDSAHFNLFALCSDGGADVVRDVFRSLDSNSLDFSSFTIMEVIKKTAEMCMPEHPMDDITIIFFLVHPS